MAETSTESPNQAAPRKSLRSRLSVRVLMPVTLAVPVVIVSAVLIWLGFHTGKQSANELAGQSTEQVHHRIEEHLTRLLDLAPAMNELEKHMLATGELSWQDMDRNRLPVFRLLNIFPEVPSIVLGSADDRAMWVIRYPGETSYEFAIKTQTGKTMDEYTLGDDGRIVSDRLNANAYSPLIRPWYQSAIQADGPTWGAVYPWVRGGMPVTLGVSYVEPVKDDTGQTLGVLCTEMTLSDISDYLSRMRIGRTGKAFIIERDGNMVANSVRADTMRVIERDDGNGGTRSDVERLPADQSEDPWIVASMRALVTLEGGLADIEQSVAREIEIDGEPMKLVVSGYTNRRNLDWLIVTVIPHDDFLGGVKRTRANGLIVGGLAVLATLFLGVFLAMIMIDPFMKLVSHVRSVAGGNLDERIDLQDNRELAELSQEINQMVEDLQDRMKLRHALGLAMEVQQSLLPDNRPNVPGMNIAARSQYCDETGGDYYDYLELAGVDHGGLVVALGDVMGHGVAAAMLMATARGILRSHVRVQGSLGNLMTHVNDLLVVDTGGLRFMTMFLGVIDPQAHTLRWASAGHDPPFIYDPVNKTYLELEDTGGLPLGVLEGEAYKEAVFHGLKPDMIMVVGTDGLWESQNEAGEQYGKDRLKQTIRELADQDADTIEQELYRRLTAYCGSRSIDDDVTYVVIQLTDIVATADPGASI